METSARPWSALWALLIGFFMILMDTTIVSIANPAILAAFAADLSLVIWATSAYLLAYAAPLLITGRLGDRFGPKRVYLAGLAVFTLASLACGLAGSIGVLVAVRAVQGIGAAMMTPQTMAIITRIFPPQGRGAAMGLWGSVAGVATLVGPLLGGVLVQTLGWEWIFFVNVPVGVVGFIAAWRLVPALSTRAHRIDGLGVALSGVGMLFLVFAIQEGRSFDWGVIAGIVSIPGLLIAGIVLIVLFLVWQRVMRGEPLLPLTLFRDRSFSLSNAAIFLVGIAITALPIPLAFYFQDARGLTPTVAALMIAPMAVVSGILGPYIGRLTDRIGPRWVTCGCALSAAGALTWYALSLSADAPLGMLLLPSAVLGVGVAGIFAPVASSATRNLPRELAGAGSGAYSAIRQVGSVLGSAAVAAVMAMRIAAEAPGAAGAGSAGRAPADVAGYAAALGQSLWLPASAFLLCAVVVAFYPPLARTALIQTGSSIQTMNGGRR
ncbi:DHA2 family efflux MFS transporter permease subunit [Microbacterium soli]|uniref:DHA2 family efflux MFS transporter permease subunit n=1 Tax=Microbacterium soli TaxID=446075 RepID=A0ABP7N2Y4_9MICO